MIPVLALRIFWLAAAVVLLAVEGVTVGLTSIWFAAGALAALLLSFFTENIWIQLFGFLIVSFGTLFAVRPMVKRYVTPSREATNADRVIGDEGIVTEEINNRKAQGQLRVRGAVWSARCEPDQDGQIIPVDARVRILRIEGVKLIVTPLEIPAGVGQQKEEV